MDGILRLCASLCAWLLGPEEEESVSEDVLGSYWPAGLVTGPLCLTEAEDDSIDLDRDIAWPVDRLSVN